MSTVEELRKAREKLTNANVKLSSHRVKYRVELEAYASSIANLHKTIFPVNEPGLPGHDPLDLANEQRPDIARGYEIYFRESERSLPIRKQETVLKDDVRHLLSTIKALEIAFKTEQKIAAKKAANPQSGFEF